MPATRRSGTRVRSLPDWYIADLVGCHAEQVATAAVLSLAGIYNNATDGTCLRVYSVDLWSNIQTEVAFETVKGQALAAWLGDTFGPIDVTSGSVWGFPIAGTSAVCLGRHQSGMTLSANAGRALAPGFPIGFIRPGYSWLCETQTVNGSLIVDIFYLQTSE